MKTLTQLEIDVQLETFRYAVHTAIGASEYDFAQAYFQFRRILSETGYRVFDNFIMTLHAENKLNTENNIYFTKIDYLHEIGANCTTIGLFDFCILAQKNTDIHIEFCKDFEKYVNTL